MFTALTMCLWLLPVGIIKSHAEAGVYITEIALMQGDLSMENLEEAGYTVIAQPLNPAGTTDLYMGYKTGSEGSAIRDLMIAEAGSTTIDSDGASYQRISDISLNTGAGGEGMYLFASYDAAAGEALWGLSFLVKQTKEGFGDDSQILASDGSEVVTTVDGKVADFDAGIGDSEVYLRMYKGNLYRPYVENVVAATAENDKDAIAELAAKRCTYYVNCDIGSEKPVYVGYTRTDDETKALRGLIAIGGDVEELATAANESDESSEEGEPTDTEASEDGSGGITIEATPEGEPVINGITYTMIDGGEIESDKKYTFYMTKDEAAGEPVMDLIACGYDPEELGLDSLDDGKEEEKEDEKTEEEGPEETEKPEEAEPEGAESEGKDEPSEESSDPSTSEGKEEGSGGDEGSDTGKKDSQSEEPHAGAESEPQEEAPASESSDETETVSEKRIKNTALGMMCVVGLNVGYGPDDSVEKVVDNETENADSDKNDTGEESGGDEESSEKKNDGESSDTEGKAEEKSEEQTGGDAEEANEEAKEESEEKTDRKESGLAGAYRIYKEITVKDWISGYFLRGGGQSASKYLYDEGEYMSAAESEDTLWISNIYCSSKKGKQFANSIGYITKPGESEADPFTETISYEEAEKQAKKSTGNKSDKEDAESTASVFGDNMSTIVICGLICAVLIAIIGSLGYKLKKMGSVDQSEDSTQNKSE